MDGEVAAPVFHHQLGKKRDPPWQPPPRPVGRDWDPDTWHWDSLRFAARPAAPTTSAAAAVADDDDEGGSLTLKLGGGAYAAAAEEPPPPVLPPAAAAARPSKRVRSGSPGNHPMCQVDDCRADLSGAKDYHRRHKVCELHSKTTKSLVANQMQRFCQQCSRFHVLSEFDEGKRSCRRRLAGHNRRRRKTQPEDASSRLLLPGNQENNANGSVDLVNLLAILARLQGSNVESIGNLASLPDKDRLVQMLSKINSLPAANPSPRLPVPGGLDLNVAQVPQSSEQVAKVNGNASAPSTLDLLAVLSTALAPSPAVTQVSLSQGSSDVTGNDKAKTPSVEPGLDAVSQSKSGRIFPLVGGRGGCALESSIEVSQHPIQEARPSLHMQLFSCPEDGSPPKFGSPRKYLSSESSNPMDERSPSSSPPVAQRLFPIHSASETMKHDRMSIYRENSTVKPRMSFKDSGRQAETAVVQNLQYQAGYVSSSASDHSPSSSNSDVQDRTGRIIFKLFDKDPSNIPGTLRTEIMNWLSHSPSEMESYIRPGCVVLSTYISMPSVAWDELEEDLHQRVKSLVQCSTSEFWRNGRFLVRTNRQLASHKDGKIHVSKSWRTWSAPELTSVLPIAVVSGEETALVLRGRNLTVPGTKIHCTYMGGYMSKEILGSTYPGTIYDDSSLESFSFPGGTPNVFGRCFIEVENGFKGNSFPVIIADATICQELRKLETEFEQYVGSVDVIEEDQVMDHKRPRSREDVLHFLNELGWLFQRRGASSGAFSADFSTLRFKFLFTFSVERDWSALVKTILDMFVERSTIREGLYQESLEMLLEVQLLSRAVNRKCRKMVDLLLNYSVKVGVGAPKVYLFPPNTMGPGGLTPLHLAASTEDSEDIVDALTNDPQEIGLSCWNSVQDHSGHSPYMYASMRNNHSYNRLVARKLADRKNGQISILVENKEGKSLRRGELVMSVDQAQQQRSCARCVMAAQGIRPSTRTRGLLQRPYVHSILAIAAVCVCVCLLFRGSPDIGSVAPFKWENLDFGPR